MKKYMVYIDDGKNLMKIAIPAKSTKEAIKKAEGNGEIIKIKDVTEEYPISEYKTFEALKKANFGEIEINYIIRTLKDYDIINDM